MSHLSYTLGRYIGRLLQIAVILLAVKFTEFLRENDADSAAARGFMLPQIPSVLTDAHARAEYLLAHSRVCFDFADTTLISRPQITEQAFADFLILLSQTSREQSAESISALMDSAAVDTAMFVRFTELAILAVYPDEDIAPWRKAAYPELMIDACDAGSAITGKPRFFAFAPPYYFRGLGSAGYSHRGTCCNIIMKEQNNKSYGKTN